MRTAIPIQTQRTRTAGFTLLEMWTAMAIFTLLTIAIVSIQLYAMRVYTLAATKLTATATGRAAVNLIREQVRSSTQVNVGYYSNSIFSIIGDNTNQIGNAIYLNPTSDETYGTVFYKDQINTNLVSCLFTNATISTNGLVVTDTGSVYNFVTNVHFITNYTVFQCEDFQGNILNNNNNNRIVHLTLMFSQWEYPIAGVGNGAMYDYYELHTRVTRRMTK
jgi:prepilin-type N-terminal cleavage/methylation domain-containing protein